MADQSEKGIQQSGGIMVNYVYRYASIFNIILGVFNIPFVFLLHL